MDLLGIGGFLGDVAGAGITAASNAKQAEMNRNFQERMSNTAHQRQVADMRAAGINPMLSGMGGSGASQPGGAQAAMPDMSSIGSRGVQSAKNANEYYADKPRGRVGKMVSEWLGTSSAKDIVSPIAAGKAIGLSDAGATALGASVEALDRTKKELKKQERERKMKNNQTSAKGSSKARAYVPRKRTKAPPTFNPGDKIEYIDTTGVYQRR